MKTRGAQSTLAEPGTSNGRQRSSLRKAPTGGADPPQKQIRARKMGLRKGAGQVTKAPAPSHPNMADTELRRLRSELRSPPRCRKHPAVHDTMPITAQNRKAPPNITPQPGVVTGGAALDMLSDALKTLGVAKGLVKRADRLRGKKTAREDVDYDPTEEAPQTNLSNTGKRRISRQGDVACIGDPLHIPTSSAWVEGLHYVIVGVKDVICKIPKCKSGTFRSVERWHSHAASKHCKTDENNCKFVSQRNLKRRKPPGQEQCSTYADLRGTIRLRWHYIKRVKLSNLKKAAVEAFKNDTSVHVPPDVSALPLIMHLFEWVAPSLGFAAWESVVDDQHYMHMRLMLEGCEEGGYVREWAKSALDSVCNGTDDDKQLHGRAKSAANQLQHAWVIDGKLPPPIKAVLRNHRKSLISEGLRWLKLERQRRVYEDEHGMDNYIEQAIRNYKRWKCLKKPATLVICERNLIGTFMRKGMSEDAARERATAGNDFVDSSEDESHPSYKEKNKSGPWRRVFLEIGKEPNGVQENSGNMEVPEENSGCVDVPEEKSGDILVREECGGDLEVSGEGGCHIKVPGEGGGHIKVPGEGGGDIEDPREGGGHIQDLGEGGTRVEEKGIKIPRRNGTQVAVSEIAGSQEVDVVEASAVKVMGSSSAGVEESAVIEDTELVNDDAAAEAPGLQISEEAAGGEQTKSGPSGVTGSKTGCVGGHFSIPVKEAVDVIQGKDPQPEILSPGKQTNNLSPRIHAVSHHEAQRDVFAEIASPPFRLRRLTGPGSTTVPARMTTFTSLLNSMGAQNSAVTPTPTHGQYCNVWASGTCDQRYAGMFRHYAVTSPDNGKQRPKG